MTTKPRQGRCPVCRQPGSIWDNRHYKYIFYLCGRDGCPVLKFRRLRSIIRRKPE